MTGANIQAFNWTAGNVPVYALTQYWLDSLIHRLSTCIPCCMYAVGCRELYGKHDVVLPATCNCYV